MCPNHPHFLSFSWVDKQMDTNGSLPLAPSVSWRLTHWASADISQINTLIKSCGARQQRDGWFFWFVVSLQSLCSHWGWSNRVDTYNGFCPCMVQLVHQSTAQSRNCGRLLFFNVFINILCIANKVPAAILSLYKWQEEFWGFKVSQNRW